METKFIMKNIQDAQSPRLDTVKGPGMRLRRRKLLALAGAGVVSCALAARAQTPAVVPGRFWKDAGMDAMHAIFTRRSHREFTGEKVPGDDLETILAAGMNAPSAHNTQPWRFVVLTDDDTLRYIGEVNPYAQYAAKAGTAILLCMQRLSGEPDELGLLSVACCAQNMMLASTALGYGSVWVQVYPEAKPVQAWTRKLRLPRDVLPVCFILVGKSAVALPPVRRADLDKVHYGSWGNKE